MEEQFVTMKVKPAALTAARLVAAKTGVKQYEAVQRVLEAEARRLGLLGSEKEEGETDDR